MKREPDIQRLLDRQARLKLWPARAASRGLALTYLVEKFEQGRDYNEREVNEVLAAWHTFDDHSMLRRALCDASLLERTPDGSRYWRVSDIPR